MKDVLASIPVLLLAQHRRPEAAAQHEAQRAGARLSRARLDDTAAYQGYQTRFYRDSRDNTVQIYLEPQTSRAVLVWADAANESVGFNARDCQGRPTRLFWGADWAEVADSDSTRSIEFRLTTPMSRRPAGLVRAGLDAGGAGLHLRQGHAKPFGAPPFRVAEESLLVADVARLPADEQRRHLELLHAGSLEQLRSRLVPAIEPSPGTPSRPSGSSDPPSTGATSSGRAPGGSPAGEGSGEGSNRLPGDSARIGPPLQRASHHQCGAAQSSFQDRKSSISSFSISWPATAPAATAPASRLAGSSGRFAASSS